jgi:hypothetical protein
LSRPDPSIAPGTEDIAMQETGVISSLTSDVAEGHTLPYHAGLMPECTTDPRRAFHLWSSDGAVILRMNRTDAPGMLAGARDAFGPRILFCQSPTTMATDTCVGSALEPRIDGCLTFGDYYPDLVFLLCERQATAGGGAFLVDGQRLIHAIASDPAQRPLIRFLWDVKLEQSRPDGGCPARTGKPVSSRRPVVSRTCGGRLTVRRHPHQHLLDDGSPRLEDRRHLAAWARLTQQAARTAPRFQLQPGDLLCLDNYRVFLGREPCTGDDPILRKMWAWSDMAFGLPSAADLVRGRFMDISAEPSR